MSEKNSDIKISWYPGHMAKAIRQMKEQLKLVDIILELRDARMPKASGNPMLKELSQNKPVLIILNKADLADPVQNERWKKSFGQCICTDSVDERLTNKVVEEVKLILKDKLEKAKARGIRKKVLRAMVVGIPNVGKSTFINNIVKKKITRTENRPGVTRSLQWIRINEDLELLDTPGVLWPKIDDQDDAKLLGLLGSINDDILDRRELLRYGLDHLVRSYPGLLHERYGIDEASDDLFSAIAREKLWLSGNNEINEDAAVAILLKDIRSQRLGRITWQHAGE